MSRSLARALTSSVRQVLLVIQKNTHKITYFLYSHSHLLQPPNKINYKEATIKIGFTLFKVLTSVDQTWVVTYEKPKNNEKVHQGLSQRSHSHFTTGMKNLTQGFTLVIVMSYSLTTVVAERALTSESTVQQKRGKHQCTGSILWPQNTKKLK